MASWSLEVADKCIEILQQNVYVMDSLDEISELLGENVTSGALRAAFMRIGINPPSSYLAKDLEVAEKPVEEVVEPPPSNDLEWKFDVDNRCYHFYHYDGHFVLTFEEVETICLMYSSVGKGLGKTAAQIASYLVRSKDYHDISQDAVEFVFKRIGFTKKMKPVAPHSRFQNMEEYVVRLNKVQDDLLKKDHNLDQLKLQQKMIKDLQGELTELYSRSEVIEELTKRPVKLFDFSNVKGMLDNSGKVVDIIPITDMHIGKFFEPHELSFLNNRYDKNVFVQQVGKICEIIRHNAKGRKVDMVLALNLGDTFEAILAQMRDGMFQGMDAWTIEAWDLAIAAMVEIIDTILEAYQCPVQFVLIGGNHCRVTRGKDERTELFTAYQLTKHLKAWYRDNGRLTIQCGSDINTILLPNGLGVIAQHGHLGPLRPLSPEKDFVNFKELHGHPKADRHLLISGHFHHTVFRSVRRDCHVCYLPAPFESDDYATKELHKNAPAEFVSFTSDEKNLLLVGPYSLE
jgi:hypothetical protein